MMTWRGKWGFPMATSAHRRRRASEAQNLLAAYLRGNGWPYAEAAGAGRNGTDITGTPGIAWEVKAVDDADFRWRASLGQAGGHGGLPVVVARGRGCGPANIADWPAIMALSDVVQALREGQ